MNSLSLPTTSLAVQVRHRPEYHRSPISQISWPVKRCGPAIRHHPLIHSILLANVHNVTTVKSPRRNHLTRDCPIDNMRRRRSDDGIASGENEVRGD